MNSCINLIHWQFKMNEVPEWLDWLDPWENYGRVIRGRVQGFHDQFLTWKSEIRENRLKKDAICISEIFITVTAEAVSFPDFARPLSLLTTKLALD